MFEAALMKTSLMFVSLGESANSSSSVLMIEPFLKKKLKHCSFLQMCQYQARDFNRME